MDDENLKRLLVIINYFLGTLIAITSFRLYLASGLKAPIYITTAILIAGPVEDLLDKTVDPKKQWVVDQITSIIFLIFLYKAVLESD